MVGKRSLLAASVIKCNLFQYGCSVSFSLFTYHKDSQQEMLGCGKTGYPLHDLYTPQIVPDTSFLYELTQ